MLLPPPWETSDMPLYFFDSDDGDRFTKDRVGVEVLNLSEAAHEAAGLLRDLAHHDRITGQRTVAVVVRDKESMPVYRVTMTITGAPITPHQDLSRATGKLLTA